MSHDTNNPFVLPGFGQTGDAADNPLFAGLEMMRQAWQNMAGAGRIDAATMPPMSLEDLERRIRELQTVQNWLQLNATMLANTIQGLEIQRSTLATLKSFAQNGAAAMGAAPAAAASSSAAQAPAGETPEAPYTQAAEQWWGLLQQQFGQLAEAATAVQDAVTSASSASASSETPAAPAKKPRAPRKPATKSATKATTSRTTPKTSRTRRA